jgi:hypothetical protein
MRSHLAPRKPSLRPNARPGVEAFEPRIPVAESIGLALAMGALADTAIVRSVQTPPPRLFSPD